MQSAPIFLSFCSLIVLVSSNEEITKAYSFMAHFGQWLRNHETQRAQIGMGIDPVTALMYIFDNGEFKGVLAEWKTFKQFCRNRGIGVLDISEDERRLKTCHFLIPEEDSGITDEMISYYLIRAYRMNKTTAEDIIQFARDTRPDSSDVLKDWNKIVQVCNERTVSGNGSQIMRVTCERLEVPLLPPDQR